MMAIRNFSFILFFILISCSKSEKKESKANEKAKKYSIIYTNNSYANLIVFDNNDTIYVSNEIQSNINKYVKIPSNEYIINEVKKGIINHLNKKSLMIERDFVLHSGYLDVSINCGNKKIQFIQSEVDRDLRVSKGFYNMISNLKEKYKEIETVF
jgi:hypothetical protein